MKIPTLQNVYSPETTEATTDNYPYGRLRCRAKWWIETHPKKGMRLGFQTVNPKTGRVNNPKYGTYKRVIVLFKNPDNGHIEHNALSAYDGPDKMQDFANKYELHGPAKEYVEDYLRVWDKHPLNPKNQKTE